MLNRPFAVVLCLLAATTIARPAVAQNTNAAEVSLLFTTPDPDLRLQSGALVTSTGITEIDFVEEFGIEKKTFPEIRFSAGRTHKFRFGYLPVRYEADAVIERTFIFNGQVFTIGAPATTDIDWNIWRFGYEWDFVSNENGFLGIVGELKYNQLEASVDSPALARAATTEQQAPIPTVGIAGRGYLGPAVFVGAEFTGLKWERGGDFDASFYDFDINGGVTFGRHVGVQAGYRSITVDYFIDDDVGDLKLKGPYFGVIAKF